jgi:hypothetical protein
MMFPFHHLMSESYIFSHNGASAILISAPGGVNANA